MANPTLVGSFLVTSADLQLGYGVGIPTLLCLSLLGVGRKEPVIKSLNVRLYNRVVILRRNIQARKMLTISQFILGVCVKELAVVGVLQG